MSHRADDGSITTQTANGVDGYTTRFSAQSATGTGSKGGNLIFASGTGVSQDGYVKIQTGARNVLLIDGYQIILDGYLNTPMILQAVMPTPGVDGYHLLVKAQSSTTSPAHGGDLVLRGGDGYNGDGYLRDGYVKLFSGVTEVIRIADNKQIHTAGERFNLTTVNSTPYNVLSTDMNLMVNTGTAKTINLPAIPKVGDAYRIKDSTGTAGANNITVQGNGNNIEGNPSNTISTNYARIFVVYNGTEWVLF